MNRLRWRILGLYYFKSQFFMMYGVILRNNLLSHLSGIFVEKFQYSKDSPRGNVLDLRVDS